MRKLAIVAAVAASLASPALGQDKATIEKLNDAFAVAFNRGDAAAVAALYAEDAVLMPAGAPMARGRAGIEAFWKGASAQLGDAKLTTIEVTPLGADYAREIGTFSLTTKAAPPQELAGKYVVIWRKVGSDWKLATDIWNSDK